MWTLTSIVSVFGEEADIYRDGLLYDPFCNLSIIRESLYHNIFVIWDHVSHIVS